MKKSVGIYVKGDVDLTKYGFEKSAGGWSWKGDGHLRSGIFVEDFSLKVTPICGYSSPGIAVLLRIAADQGIIIDDAADDRNVLMRLTKEEALAIEKMRGHPKEETR